MSDISTQDVDAFLEHHGVKGQKWGVRHPRAKKGLYVLGGVATAAAVIAGGVFIKKRFHVKTSSIPKPPPVVKKFAESIAKEPVDIIHSTRGYEKGFMFLRGGGISSHLHEAESSGLIDSSPGFFKRYGSRAEKVAVSFLDPEGRKDQAGRAIFHQVILPESMAKDIHTHDDAVKEAWPRIKDLYGAMYKTKPGTLGPGF